MKGSKATGSGVAAPAAVAGSTADAEMQAVRNRALASANLGSAKRQTPTDPAANGTPAPPAAGVKPILRLRASPPQQVGSPSVCLS